MQVCLIMAVSHQGCTAHIRDMFLERLTAQCPDAQVRQFVLPKDGPGFCLGCKQCFTKDISACPHHAVTGPIWQAMEDSELIVFIMPTYVFGVPAQLKALLDHFGGRWIVHQPSPAMLSKRALIIDQAAGAGLRPTVQLMRSNLNFWGVGAVKAITARMGDTDYAYVSPRVKAGLSKRMDRAIARVRDKGAAKPGLKVKALYRGMAIGQRLIHQMQMKKGRPETSDHAYWQAQGWLKGRFPWKT